MTQTTTGEAGSVGSVLSAETVFALRRFHHQNAPDWAGVPAPRLDDPAASDAELRDLLVFAGRALGNGDPTVPRHLEAHRVLGLVPEEVGAALFADQMQADHG